MTYFIKKGNTYRPTNEQNLDIHQILPPGNFVIRQTMDGEMFFELVDSFEFKGKRYGDNSKNTDRILSTFMGREVSTGVVLTGEKGSGKSLLAKTIAMKAAADMGIPTIIINAPYCGEGFNAFVQKIEQPTIILFDEFEKVYDSQQQEQLLTLFDGVFSSKKLFIITCNDKWRVDDHMRNRPGRIFYMLDFNGLENEFIEEYCQDNLNNKSYIKKVCDIASLFSRFNFDMLKALVEEMNRYDEAPEVSLNMLNVRPEFDGGCLYDLTLVVEGKILSTELHGIIKVWNGNPLIKQIIISYRYFPGEFSNAVLEGIRAPRNDLIAEVETSDTEVSHNDIDPNECIYGKAMFSYKNLVKVDSANGMFEFANDKNQKLILKKSPPQEYKFYDSF